MTFWGKAGKTFRALGSKVAGAASYLGNKVGNTLMTLAPVASRVNPALGAGFAGAGAVAKGIGALGDLGKSALSGNTGVQQLRHEGGAALGSVTQGARAVRDAYNAFQGRSPLERPG